MKKLIETILFLVIFSFAFVKPVWAGELNILLNDLPAYQNKTDFSVFYTVIETDQLPVKVNLFIQKEGKDWRQTVEKDKTSYSGEFKLHGSDLYDGEGKYNFYATVASLEKTMTSNTISTILDTIPPEKVSDYRKERINPHVFRLYFKCSSDSDFEKVYLYRSRETSFEANADTRIAEVGGAPGESKTYEIGGDPDVEYYFALRALDHAGNISGVVTDAPETVVAGQVAGAVVSPTGVSTARGEVVSLPKEEPTAIPTEETEEGELGGGISAEEKVLGEKTPKASKLPYILTGAGLLILAGVFLAKKKQD